MFEAEASILRSWLSAARSKLTGIKQLSSTDMKSIAVVRSKIDKILVSIHQFHSYSIPIVSFDYGNLQVSNEVEFLQFL